MVRMLVGFLFVLLTHRVCCARIPAWTAHVGQRWDTYDIAPLNLYNVLWRVQSWVRRKIG